ncbi:MAG: porin [Desulfuromonadales bacterium]
MKLFKVLVAALVMVGMAMPVIAEDRLKLSGEMRTRAFTTDYSADGVASDNNHDVWANQRLRVAGTIAVAEGVSISFRTDITEGTNWGDSSTFGAGPGNPERTNGSGHARSGSQQQWDRAYMDLTTGMFHLRAGQQYVGTGGTWAVDTQDSGLLLNIKTSVPITLFGIVDRDGGSKSAQDSFLYGGYLAPKGDSYSAKIIAAGYHGPDSLTPYLLGVSGSTDFGPVKVFGEFDYFTGDHDSNTDAFGTQLFLDGSMAVTDALTVGLQGFYALGDNDDQQYVRLGNGFNGWDPIMDVGTSLSNEEIVLGAAFQPLAAAGFTSFDGNPMDFTGASAGVMSPRLYGNFKLSDDMSFGLSGAYLTVEDDSIVDVEEWAFAAGYVYKFLPNTSFQLQAQYVTGTVSKVDRQNINDVDFNAFSAGTGLFVSF